MTELLTEDIGSFENILTNIQIANQALCTEKKSDFESIIKIALDCNYSTDNNSMDIDYSELSKFKTELDDELFKNNLNILDNFQAIEIQAKQKNKEESCDFNMLRLFSIGETMHSQLLANFLNPNSEHGQGNLFLFEFLEKIGIERPELGQWIVTAEKGRIDVLLKRVHPHSVVIIENKSNFAVDRDNQLYRYWYQEIYYPNRHLSFDYSSKHPEKYQIIYLTPADWKQPVSNTFEKPLQWPINLPKRMPMDPSIWKFNKEIIEWLNQSIVGVSRTNHRLIEYIKQYIEYWN